MNDTTQPADAMSPIEVLFALKPNQGQDPVGAALHATWMAMVENSLPGQTHDSIVDEDPDTNDPFASDFFPKRAADPSASLVGGLNADWWASYSTALVCQAMANMVMTVRPLLNLTAITADLVALSPALAATARVEYASVFKSTFASTIAPVLAGTTPAAAAGAYGALLTSPAWIALKQAAIVSGQWPDAAWELFNHTLKWRALGASDVDVSAALLALANGGLTMPPEFTAANWIDYQPYLRNPPLVWNDLSTDGQDGLHAPSYFWRDNNDMFGRHISTDSSATPDGLALEFVKTVKYYVAPSGSCFTPACRVLLPDGSDRAISELAPGDEVWTPDGPRAVRVAATSARMGRLLWRLNGARFAFSDSHPFVAGGTPGQVTGGSLAIHPPRAATYAQGIAATGLSRLQEGATVVTVDRQGRATPAAVASTAEFAAGPSEAGVELLVDLILRPGASGFPAYAVGDGGEGPFYLVRSEVLRYEQHVEGTSAGLAVLVGSLPATTAAMAPLSRDESAAVGEAVRLLAPGLAPEALRRLAAGDLDLAPELASTPIHERLDALLDAFHRPGDAQFDWRLGALQESLAAHVVVPFDHLVSSSWASFTSDAANVASIAITLHDLVAEGHFRLGTGWTVSAVVDGVPMGSAPIADQAGTSHRRPIGWTATLPLVGPPGRPGPTVVELELRGPGPATLVGRTVLRADLLGGYHHSGVLMCPKTAAEGGGGVDATVTLDARWIGGTAPSGARADVPVGQGNGDRQGAAHRLGQVIAALFAERFPAALQAARKRTGSRRRPS